MSAMIPALFAKLATCVDPFIYALNHPKNPTETFRRLRHLIPCVDKRIPETVPRFELDNFLRTRLGHSND